MSKIIRGIRVPTDDELRTFAYLAVFSDGDFRKHITNYPKTHCLRVTLAPSKRWQEHPYIMGREVIDGKQLHEWRGGNHCYEWFKSEQEALRVANRAAKLTMDWFLGECHVHGPIHPLNEPYKNNSYYSHIEVVSPKIVWDRSAEFVRQIPDRVILGCSEVNLKALQEMLPVAR